MVLSRPASFDTPTRRRLTRGRFSSMFSQLLYLFPRTEFQALVKRTYAERHARGFTCWGQFVAMLFCQLGRARVHTPVAALRPNQVGHADEPTPGR